MPYFVKAPLVTKNKLNGIIFKLKNNFKIDPIVEKIIVPSSVYEYYGTSKTLIYWNETRFTAGECSKYSKPWFQLYFPDGFIYPTAFSMRGVSSRSVFPSSWDVLGIPAGQEDNEKNWIFLQQTASMNRHTAKTTLVVAVAMA